MDGSPGLKRLENLRGWISMTETVLSTVESTGLSHLDGCMFRHLDMPLISAFVERWQPDTNTFHMSFGEIKIILHDVFYILWIHVDGVLVSGYTGTSELKDDMERFWGFHQRFCVVGLNLFGRLVVFMLILSLLFAIILLGILWHN